MSARISGVKNFESKAVSLLRGLPFSQVQSQSEKGSIFSFFAGAVETSLAACITAFSIGAGGATATAVSGAWAAGRVAATRVAAVAGTVAAVAGTSASG